MPGYITKEYGAVSASDGSDGLQLREPLLAEGGGEGGAGGQPQSQSSLAKAASSPTAIDANLLFSMLGNAFEWYDFAVFGYIALELSQEIFPSGDESTALVEAFSVYAVAFLCRPISGILLGMLGDKWGRKNTITLALVMMGVATLIAGAAPTYRTAGIWSPITLCIARMVQGLSVGAQSTGTFLLVLEKEEYSRHGILTAILIASQLSGFILGGLIPSIMRFVFTPDFMRVWGWRLALWIGLVPCVFTFMTHANVEDEYEKDREQSSWDLPRDNEQQQQQQQQQQHTGEKTGTVELELDFLGIFLSFGIYVGGALVFYLNMVWMPLHLQKTSGPAGGLAGTLAVATFALILIPTAGFIIDRMDPYIAGIGARGINGLFALPLMLYLLAEPSISRYGIVMSMMLPLLAFDFVSTTKLLVPYFPAKGRYVSIAVAHNAGVGLTGGTAPMLAQYLLGYQHGTLMLGAYISFALIFASLSVLALRCRQRCYFPGAPGDKSLNMLSNPVNKVYSVVDRVTAET
mmetsp:Transcript_24893/g.44279  ORF Transcript_24893/g.44279 Transcript_24893/m.44279 type:complete len:519 (-) Transcript_24893:138-1694(-)|eukprot:CAMPEP_0197530998 /NCGR_PEP_ID=MMETSP1318-20131121/33729_1 /TAXON_ID=552666 /ORGANISM="Partenskyella glossopodia, Strain RCC365" /LENGTH=518 /DNA_ID=CAMNT_0043087049 /DNA_START=174 /DNA_END=1730 /DNA_ORIENTATION=-